MHFSDVCVGFCCVSSETLLSHVEQLLRAMILKISVCDAVLDNNPPGRSSAITTKRSIPVIELILIKHKVLIDLHLNCGFLPLSRMHIHSAGTHQEAATKNMEKVQVIKVC